MTFKLLTCHRRQKRPKTNLASARKSSNAAKAKSSSRSHKKSSRTRRLHAKSSYLASNVLSPKNFYPANYFFQDHQRARVYDSSTSRVGVNDHYGFLITARNPPQLPTMNANHPRQRMSQFTHSKVGQNDFFWYLRMSK